MSALHDALCVKDSVCLLCRQRFSTKTKLSKHYKLAHRNSKAGYSCMICLKNVGASYVAFTNHVVTHHSCFYVPNLPEYGITQMSLSEYAENRSRYFTCEQCNELFANASRFRLHGIVASNFACNYCNALFCSFGSISKHMRQNHKDKPLPKQTFECRACKNANKVCRTFTP